EALAIWREAGDRPGVGVGLGALGLVALERGDYAVARDHLAEALAIWRQLGIKTLIAESLARLAMVAGAQGHAARAARLFGAAQALYGAAGGGVSPVERGTYERQLAAARTQLDEGAWSAAWAEGRAMPLEQAVAYALEPRGPEQAEAAPWQNTSARLITQGGEARRLVAEGLADG
ncbi:MAG TPA: tetratricopeptide repeat protein, partial [Vicinamibacteria bacterium]